MDDVTQENSDRSLIIATLSGDDEAFALLITRYKGRIFRLASRFARDNDELEDICQESFIKAYENLENFRHAAPFEHWITKITVRSCHDALRARRHEKLSQTWDELSLELQDKAESMRSEARQAREFLKWAMGFLTPDERLVLTLLELEGMTIRETAEMTGWSETNVKVRGFRARQSLKKILEKNHVP